MFIFLRLSKEMTQVLCETLPNIILNISILI